jgi:hypothetical protein
MEGPKLNISSVISKNQDANAHNNGERADPTTVKPVKK